MRSAQCPSNVCNGEPQHCVMTNCYFARHTKWYSRCVVELRIPGRCLAARRLFFGNAMYNCERCRQTSGYNAHQHAMDDIASYEWNTPTTCNATKKKTIRAAVRRHVFANAHADQTIKVRQTSSVCWFRFGKQSSMERMKQKVTGRAIFGVCARVALVCCCFVVSDFSFFLKTHQRRPRWRA